MRNLLIALALVASVWAVYGRTASFDFVNYDDPGYVTSNPIVQRGLTLEGAQWAFTTGRLANWHPLTWLSHMLDCELHGLDAGAHHATNVALHAFNSVLLFLVFQFLTGATWRSAGVAALFALHPLHVESVAWVSERKDLLSGAFALLAIAAYAAYARSGGWARYTLVAALLALGLMCKPMLVTLPALFLLLDYWPLERVQGWLPKRALWVEKLPLLLLSVASSLVTLSVQQRAMGIGIEPLPLHLRLANAAVAAVRYVELTLWPRDLAVLYPHPYLEVAGGTPWGAGHVATAIAALALLSVLFLQRVPQRHAAVGWLWFLGMLVPVIGIVHVGMQAMADRYMYLPQIGLFVILVWGGAELLERRPAGLRFAGIGAAVVALVVLGVVASAQVEHWRNSITLFSRALTVAPRTAVVHANLGAALLDAGRAEEASTYLSRAVELDPKSPPAVNNLGIALQRQGRVADAIEVFEYSVGLGPKNAVSSNLLGRALEAEGRLDEAIARYEHALSIRPRYAPARQNLDRARARRERED